MATLRAHQFCGLVPQKRSAILQQKRLAVPACGKKRLQREQPVRRTGSIKHQTCLLTELERGEKPAGKLLNAVLGSAINDDTKSIPVSTKSREDANLRTSSEDEVKEEHPSRFFDKGLNVEQHAATFSLSSRDSDLLASANPHEEYLEHYSPLVKMCGITTPEDASLVAQAGAWYVGMIMWPHSKRSVKSMSLAREICAAAQEFGAEPVGVFVSESASEIERVCDAAGLSFAQLHGDGARASILELSRSLKTIYVMQSDAQGCLQTMISPELEKVIDWVLVDGLEGGSGSTFAWHNFKVPSLCTNKGWLLAGGLNPENVTKAISILRPNAVDVVSGIAGSDGIRKDPSRILAFMEAVSASCVSPCFSV
ncbi:unnamed protein product [Calypogeia fissa]